MKFKMAAAAILNLHPAAILKHCRLYAVGLNYHTKFHETHQSTTEL